MRVAAALALFACVGCSQPATNSGPPRGGEKLLPAAESAIAVVVGRVDGRDQVDTHGYASDLSVERSLLATPPAGSLRITWEELATKRKPRLQPGDAVLVALTQLPSASLWDQRFPGARAAGSVLAIAASGDAYMLNPDNDSLDLLERYLRLAPEQREAPAGIEALAQMVSSASAGVAMSAVQRLAAVVELEKSPESALRPLGAALNDERRPQEVRLAVIDLIGARKLSALRPQLDAIAERASALQAPALAAIGVMDGSLSGARVANLLSNSDPAVRMLGARFATAPDLEQQLIGLVKNDPDPGVRGTAAAALIRIKQLDAFDQVVPALADANPQARLAAVEAVGKLGAAAVPRLSALARGGSLEEATGAVLALDQCGAAGKTALVGIAADHPDERVRRVAMLALGKLGGHEH